MSITYAAQAGTQITSHAMNENCINQTDQTGNNTVVVSDDIVAAGNGQIGTKFPDYAGRLIIINLGLSSEQRRQCLSSAAISGPTVANSWLITVLDDWDTNPVATTDTIHVAYDVDDIESGGAGGGINLNGKTGLYELSNLLAVNNGGGLQNSNGQALEVDDRGNNVATIIQSGGRLYSGYLTAGQAVNGGVFTAYNNSSGEPTLQFQSGSEGFLYSALVWAQLVAQQFECANGSDVLFDKTKFISFSDELFLYDATLIDVSASGKGGTTEIVRADAGTSTDGLVISSFNTLDSAANTTTETITLGGVVFIDITNPVTIRQNKTWYLIDPIWDVTTYTDLTWNGTSTLCYLYDQRSVNAVVQEADGTKLQNALINVYENTQLDDLVVEDTTDVDGVVSNAFTYKFHETNSATTTYGGHAVQAGKWLYKPFVTSQVSDEKFNSTIVLSPDDNILQTTQATAITGGSGVTWNEDTNPSSVIEFTGGTGGTIGLAVGDTITGASSGADGIVTQILDGDGTAGTIHLKTRDANDFTTAETIGNGADGWTATFTTDSQQDFSIWIDGNDVAYQGLYDYLAARQTETTLSATGELIWEWCRAAQTQPLYATGSSFFTEMSNGKGIIIIDGGAGTIDHFTDDAGVQWVPPASVTISVTVLDDSTGLAIGTAARVYIARNSDKSVILSSACNASGVASTPFSYTGDVEIVGWAREFNISGTDYVSKDISGTITSSGFTLTVRLVPQT